MQAMVARLPQITNMTIEAILTTDFFIPLGQPPAPSETLPFKSGIKITRKKPMTTPLIPVAAIVNLDEIRVEPSTSTPIKTLTSARSKPSTSARSKPSTAAQVKPSAQVKTSAKSLAQAKPLAQSKPSAQPSTSAQTESSSSAQQQLSDHEDHSTDDDEPQASTPKAIEILDFSNILPTMPKNVYTEFYDIFPVKQPNVKKLNKDDKKVYDAQQKIYRKRRWEHIGRNISLAEKEAKKAKALKEGYVMSDDGKTQFTIKAYHGVKRGYFGRVYQVAVEFTDNVVRWVNPEELINARTSLNQYLDKLNIPNPEINKKKIKLSVPDFVFEAKQKQLNIENARIEDFEMPEDFD